MWFFRSHGLPFCLLICLWGNHSSKAFVLAKTLLHLHSADFRTICQKVQILRARIGQNMLVEVGSFIALIYFMEMSLISRSGSPSVFYQGLLRITWKIYLSGRWEIRKQELLLGQYSHAAGGRCLAKQCIWRLMLQICFKDWPLMMHGLFAAMCSLWKASGSTGQSRTSNFDPMSSA